MLFCRLQNANVNNILIADALGGDFAVNVVSRNIYSLLM